MKYTLTMVSLIIIIFTINVSLIQADEQALNALEKSDPSLEHDSSSVNLSGSTVTFDSIMDKSSAMTWEQTTSKLMQLRFVSAFIASISMILVSEVGDKTFFIAAIMAMRHSRNIVFSAAMCALAIMTVLSAAIGLTLPTLLPPNITHYCAVVLFLYFGVKLLYDAYHMSDQVEENDELREVEDELEKLESDSAADKLENGVDRNARKYSKNIFYRNLNSLFSRVFIQVFTMTFLAEWGDRSQIATIALAAAKDPVGVSVGAVLGHCCCTGLAVVGGKLLAARISEKTVAYVGGGLFLIFALTSSIYGE